MEAIILIFALMVVFSFCKPWRAVKHLRFRRRNLVDVPYESRMLIASNALFYRG